MSGIVTRTAHIVVFVVVKACSLFLRTLPILAGRVPLLGGTLVYHTRQFRRLVFPYGFRRGCNSVLPSTRKYKSTGLGLSEPVLWIALGARLGIGFFFPHAIAFIEASCGISELEMINMIK